LLGLGFRVRLILGSGLGFRVRLILGLGLERREREMGNEKKRQKDERRHWSEV